MEYYTEILQAAAMWMTLENIMLSKVSQRERERDRDRETVTETETA